MKIYNRQQPIGLDSGIRHKRLKMHSWITPKTGHITGVLNTMREHSQVEAIINTKVAKALKTFVFEREYFSRI